MVESSIIICIVYIVDPAFLERGRIFEHLSLELGLRISLLFGKKENAFCEFLGFYIQESCQLPVLNR